MTGATPRKSRATDPVVEDLGRILATAKTVAVVGLSNRPGRPSHDVACYLKEEGYRVIPVNPNIEEALGEKAYSSLRDIRRRVDIVQIFRRPEYVPAAVDDAIAIGAKVVWMQSGIRHEAAAARARAAGLKVVMDSCMAVVHRGLRVQGLI
jgi:predicted CoA-binding protein